MSQAIKFDHVLVTFEPDVIAELDNFLIYPLPEKSYDKLCKLLIRRFDLNKETKMKRLNLQEPGNRKLRTKKVLR